MLQGINGRSSPVVQPQAAEDIGNVVFDGAFADKQLLGDFTIGGAERFYALASIEPFQDFGASFNLFSDLGSTFRGDVAERIRTNIGIGKKLTPALRIDLNYLFHKIRVRGGDSQLDLDDHVVRLRFFYRFN